MAEHDAEYVDEPMTQEPQRRNAPLAKRSALGETSMTRHETQGEAMAQLMVARVQASHAIAQRFKRNMHDVRTAVLAECKDPSFAAVARYMVPRGGKTISGPSIRFVELMMQQMHHIEPNDMVVYEDNVKRIVRVTVIDYQNNFPASTDIVIEKVVERKALKDGQRPIDTRANSYGDTVYLVPATEADVRMKQAAEVSKAIRTLALRMMPRALVKECEEEIIATMDREDKRDPKAAQKKVVDAFAAAGIKAAQLEEYMARTLDGIGPELLGELRCVYAALRDGDATWDDLLAGSPHRKAEETAEGNGNGKAKDAVKELLQKKAEQAKEKAAKSEPVKPAEQAPAAAEPKRRGARSQAGMFDEPDPDQDGR